MVDSKNCTVGLATIVIEAAKFIENNPNATAEEVISFVEEMRERTRFVFLPQSLLYLKAGDKVYFFADLIINTGQTNSFHEFTKKIIPVEIIFGFIIGGIISFNIFPCPMLSRCAYSIIEFSTPRMLCLIRKMPNASVNCGSITPMRVSLNPQEDMVI